MTKPLRQASAAIWTPTKLNPQQEKFVRLIAEGLTQPAAYQAAGYVANTRNVADAGASRLLKSVKIRSRLGEILSENAYAAQVTIEYISKELRNTYHLALAEKQTAGATQALMGLAKLHGYLWDRQQIEMVVRRPSADPDSPDTMSPEEWTATFSSPQIEHRTIEHDEKGGANGTDHPTAMEEIRNGATDAADRSSAEDRPAPKVIDMYDDAGSTTGGSPPDAD